MLISIYHELYLQNLIKTKEWQEMGFLMAPVSFMPCSSADMQLHVIVYGPVKDNQRLMLGHGNIEKRLPISPKSTSLLGPQLLIQIESENSDGCSSQLSIT
jgi:hypothetical protein